jgi:hypothetical protein
MAKHSEARRFERVAAALEDILQDGDELVVRCEDGEIEISEAGMTICREKHPQLYGYLLSFNEELSSAGTSVTLLGLFPVALICLGIHLEWWDRMLGGPYTEPVRSIWFYIVVLLGGFFAFGAWADTLEKRAYRQGRDELISLLRSEGIHRDTLLSMIEGDPSVSRVSRHLKLDSEARSASR